MLEMVVTGHVVQSSWTAKQLDQVHGFEFTLPIKLTHWQLSYSSYFAPSLDIVGMFERKRKYENFDGENFWKLGFFITFCVLEWFSLI